MRQVCRREEIPERVVSAVTDSEGLRNPSYRMTTSR